MHTKLDLDGLSRRIVYLKPVATSDLPDDLREQAGPLDTIFSVHNGDGEQVALVADPAIAVDLAEKHSMELVTVH